MDNLTISHLIFSQISLAKALMQNAYACGFAQSVATEANGNLRDGRTTYLYTGPNAK